jgi:leucine-rich repeat protein SHOC2
LTTNIEDLVKFASWLRLNGMKNRISLDINELSKLRSFNLSDSKELEELPEIFNNMYLLEEINLANCSKFKSLPTIDALQNLTNLNLSNTPISDLPHNLDKNISLKNLNLTGTKIQGLPENLQMSQSIEELDLTDCRQLIHLPSDISNMKLLNTLKLTNCRNLEDLPVSLLELIHLKHLYIGYCPNISNIEEILNNINSIEILDISNTRLEKFELNGENLQNLRVLYCENTSSISSLPSNFHTLESLEQLTIRNSTELFGFGGGFFALKNFKGLYISGCSNIEITDDLLDLGSLEKIEIDTDMYNDNKKLFDYMKDNYIEVVIV